jgi:hypothetical protein
MNDHAVATIATCRVLKRNNHPMGMKNLYFSIDQKQEVPLPTRFYQIGYEQPGTVVCEGDCFLG